MQRLAAVPLLFALAGPSSAAAVKKELIEIAPELAPAAAETRLADDLAVRPLRAGFWLHASTSPDGIAANGLLAPLPEGGVLLVDTPWSDAQTERLVAWAAGALGGIREAVVTHAHADRMGGLGALRRLGIPARALDLTAAKARAEGLPVPEVVVTAAARLHVDPRGFEVFYPGPGHTVDNLVVAFPKAGIVHGGCLVKSTAASGVGYVAESFPGDWGGSIEAVRDRYPEADVIVPGHGPVGGRAAFARSLAIGRLALAQDEQPRRGGIHEAVPTAPDVKARWAFYLHGAIVEREGRHAVSPDFGPYQFDAILEALARRGFEVVAELRRPEAGLGYADRLIEQVGKLRRAGVPAERIVIVGASRGGHLALRAAARLAHPGLTYVVLAGCGPDLLPLAPELRGRVLSIRDDPDRFDPTCAPLFAASPGLTASREIVLHLGLDHGLLYAPRSEWLDPAAVWTRGALGRRGQVSK